ncbi:MAG: hypothetical protein U1E05_23035 [Patescibacteria group bacterium]|nr:hypothetical protein [Patescibacteria group bacterium]
MSRILLAWELGVGLGHLTNILPFARGLCGQGHQVFLALKDLSQADRVFAGLDVAYLQAPIQTRTAAYQILPPVTFGHILHNIGFGDPRELRTRVEAWRHVYQYVKPDLIVFDHSPTALLAATGVGAKRVLVGTGFFWPPDESPLRSLRPWMQCDVDRLAADEDRVLQNVNQVLAFWRQPKLERLSRLYYDIEESFLLTFRELDHYGERPSARYWGSWSYASGIEPAWPEGKGKHVYAYFKPFPALPSALSLLRELRTPTLVYMDRVDAGMRKRFESASLRFEAQPLDIASVARQCDVAIINGNHGTAVSFLLAGKPALHIPIHLEQAMFSARVANLGAGLIAPARSPERIAIQLMKLLNSNQYTSAAAQVAARYAGFDPQRQIAGMMARIEQLLQS